jgi:signal transduction histidine kinase/DNA-binding NarL/FixJ family response regulator
VIHLLLIAEESLASSQAAALFASTDHKIIRRDNFEACSSLLASGVFDLLVLPSVDLPKTLGLLSSIRASARTVPVVLLTAEASPEIEQRAYAAGADLVLQAPLSLATFTRATRSLLTIPARGSPATPPLPAPGPAAAPLATSALEVLRDFSRVLSYSLDHKLFTQHFVLKLREILSVNRIAIFLEPMPSATPAPAADGRGKDRLTCIAAVGISNDLLECIELSRHSGIGRQITHSGQILRLDAESSHPFPAEDFKIRREFEILGCQAALPINDRERILGVALIGGRVTGHPLENAELQLVYHLLEELGLAVKNSWLHHQLAASHRLFSDVLGANTSGSLVVGADLSVLHANRAFLCFLRGEERGGSRLDFSELPPPLAAALHDLAEKGRQADPFFLTSEKNPGRTYRISLVPFPTADRRLPQPAMALVEDYTQIQAVQRAEIEASNLKLITLIAKRFAHEIRNSLVPLSTHHQLLDTDYASAEFRESLKSALGRETGRIQRFTEQMLFISQPAYVTDEWAPVGPLLREAFKQASRSLGKEGRLEITGEQDDTAVRIHRASFLHALEEIFLNGLQENPADGRLHVSLATEADATGAPRLSVRFRDQGPGFTAENARRATEPFFTTRTTGVGLGLTVARRIVENHAGGLTVLSRTGPDSPDIVISLPLL